MTLPPPGKPGDGQDLQFDRAVPNASGSTSEPMTCGSCASPLRTWYFDVDGQHVCTTCKNKVASASGPVREWRPTLRALLFGFGAAIAGAIIYYGVIAITNFEIGIVALLIGYMVGFSVRKGSGGRGGRRLQVAGAALTYLSVSLAYLPLAMKGAVDASTRGDSASIATDSLVSADEQPNAITQDESEAPVFGASDKNADADINPIFAIGMLFAFALALPLMVVFGTFPSGLISALIIGIGIRQAWVMTRAAEVTVAGPFKVGAKASADSAGPAATAA